MLLSKEELEKASVLHPQIAEFLANNPPPLPPPDANIHITLRKALRAGAEATLARLGPAPAWLSESYHDIPMRDGYMSSIKVQKPSNGPAGPLVVLCFGGGFIAGDSDQQSQKARALAKLFGATVVNINSRLAPEHKFPQSQYDAIDSVKWIAENASRDLLAADPSKGFIMGGISAGAILTRSHCLASSRKTSSLTH
ncbi:hypothetical protein LTR37_011998 [Vermiconidia calcicola]|uniref:Uncharacterized protein n=1 Tax=Vermiconidia calcicola TaxID=1690605 RepID=A0ACC3N290_9PEZI|nr:hypothetical protein LTR37_011998 [Vermiconidia calcicola]